MGQSGTIPYALSAWDRSLEAVRGVGNQSALLLGAPLEFFLLKLSHALEKAFLAFTFGWIHLFELRLGQTPDDPGLHDGDEVGSGPVQSKCAGVGIAESEKEQGHETNDTLLHGVSAYLWSHAHLQDHGDRHDDG